MEMVISSNYAYHEPVALYSVAISADQYCLKNGSPLHNFAIVQA